MISVYYLNKILVSCILNGKADRLMTKVGEAMLNRHKLISMALRCLRMEYIQVHEKSKDTKAVSKLG